MKHPLLLLNILYLLLLINPVHAQSPQSFKYQTILRNLSGQPIANRAVRFQVGIQRGMNGPIVYQEQHSDTTNAQGLAILEVGRGTLINNSPAFSTIRWDSATYFLAMAFDSTGNGNFLNMGSFELLSVPYALYAQSSGNSTPGPQGPQGIPGPQGPPGNGLNNGTINGQTIYWNGSAWVNLNPGNNNQLLTLCDSIPTWTVNGQCPGTITSLSCSTATHNGTLTSGISASGVSSSIPYTGGNGFSHNGQTITSSGVTGLTATLSAGSFVNGNGSLSYTITGTPAASGTASFAISIGGQNCTLTRTIDPGLISSLSCSTATHNGTLTSSVAASGVSSSIPYTGGNGGPHNGQTITSTGVTGLTAALNPGNFVIGNGNLSYTITGTPASSGTALFSINIGGQSCTLTRTVDPALIGSWRPGMVHCSSPTQVASITNPSTNKTWMDRNLGATQVATNSTDANAYGDLYQWGRFADGHQCRNSSTTTSLSTSDDPGNTSFILSPSSTNGWRDPQNNNLWQSINGNNNPCPFGYRLPTEAELEAERGSWSSNNATGAISSPLKLPLSGYRHFGHGLLNEVGSNGGYWSITFSGTNARFLNFTSSSAAQNTYNRGTGFSIRCIQDCNGQCPGTLTSLSCSTATHLGTLTEGNAASGVSSTIPYTGGNGGPHNGQTVTSTGVTGLTATLSAGSFVNGNGSLSYTITGTPASTGTASFAINIGGQSCTLTRTIVAIGSWRTGMVHCGTPTQVVDVINPTTGRIWMDRNLGAAGVATSTTDANSYGDLYQWGRFADGHQCRGSSTTTTLSNTDNPGNNRFILSPNSPFDWRSGQNHLLWQGVNGINNPCPTGYRIPTDVELENDRLSWPENTLVGAFNSILKFPSAGTRNSHDGSLNSVGTNGSIWSSNSFLNSNTRMLTFGSLGANMSSNYRASGRSVRCIKD